MRFRIYYMQRLDLFVETIEGKSRNDAINKLRRRAKGKIKVLLVNRIM